MQFGDDWRGYFLRGDDAMRLAMSIRMVLDHPGDPFAEAYLLQAADALCGVSERVPQTVQRAALTPEARHE
jgi:hypothetical protein